jgi:hypothetical protein
MRPSRIAIAALAVIGMAAASFAIAAPAEAATTVRLTKTLSGSGAWTIPSSATNIVVTLSSAEGADFGGAGGSGESARYALADSAAGSALAYTVGTVGSGNLPRPDGHITGAGGGASAIAIGAAVLAVVGGGGGGAGDGFNGPAAGGVGGVATMPGVAVGGDGQSLVGFTAAGQGGQVSGGGLTPRAASYFGSSAYGGSDGQNGPASVSGGVITLAMGGFSGYLGGDGGSGYTGGAGGTCDYEGGNFDDGAGGGGSGYLASTGISYVGGSAGLHTGAGSLVITYDVPQLVVSSNAAVGGHVGQSYSWSPENVSSGTSPYGYALEAGSTLPAGLALSAADGSISGTPTASGTSSFSVMVMDANGQTASLPLQIAIGTLTVTAPAQAEIGGALTLSGSGYDVGSYDVELDGATPTIGMATAAASGVLTFAGTVPAGATPGAHTIGVYRGGILVATASVTLVTGLIVNATTAPSAFQGQDFSWTPVAVTGGTAPVTYAIQGPLPAGLIWDAATDTVSGSPTATTTVPTAFSITVTDASATPQSQTVALTLSVGALSITAPASAVVGTTITVTGAGFEEGDYTVELHSSPVVLGTVHVDATHTLSFTGTVPSGVDPGVHQLQVLRASVLVSTASITIAAAPAVVASTGVDTGPGMLLALLLIAAGLVVAVTRRLRRSRV